MRKNICDSRRKAGKIKRKLKNGDTNGERKTSKRKRTDEAERTGKWKLVGRARDTEKKNRR